ncbi:guanine nucleotide exchange factor for Rab-3A isoform X4 [Ailuropoda melanoleuca]|uniref:guanine nucleotide exchange factor for Rab-3A isoform X4 n=1 Tax=Ailuropoda melanoleuca TaxID=9646 RepID=UPI001493E0E2|nr:guanine nucleotide exchange factor for Rab-3A isoform X4 [Ailuropoda melanoleuca]
MPRSHTHSPTSRPGGPGGLDRSPGSSTAAHRPWEPGHVLRFSESPSCFGRMRTVPRMPLRAVTERTCAEQPSQPHPDEGHPPPLEAVPVPWKSVGPCKSHRESPGGLAETPGGEEAQGEEGPAAGQLDVLRLRSSSMEIREKGSEFLKEELHKAQKELKLKDEECERLSKVREQLERELEELTASLFEEAHKMVREANMKQAASEKQLKEARGKIDMLQAEVSALKTLVLTSTPASPNRELHPQLLSPTKAGPRKGHLRHKSTSSALCPAVCPAAGHTLTPDKEGKEPGLPPLLSLLLCVVPSKAVHLTYEPAWQLLPGEPPAAPISATSLSFSRQVMAPPSLTHTACAPGRPASRVSRVGGPVCVPSVCMCLCVRARWGVLAGHIFSFSSSRRQRGSSGRGPGPKSVTL